MSASWGLVRFKRTGNVYYCCYEGTSDTLNQYICTAEECYDEKIDCYCAITYCRDLLLSRGYAAFPENVTDLDDVEIYSDYGGGFYWNGTGSESIKMIKDGLDTLEGDIDEIEGRPDWVNNFLSECRNKYLEKLWRRYQETGKDEDYKAYMEAKNDEW